MKFFIVSNQKIDQLNVNEDRKVQNSPRSVENSEMKSNVSNESQKRIIEILSNYAKELYSKIGKISF